MLFIYRLQLLNIGSPTIKILCCEDLLPAKKIAWNDSILVHVYRKESQINRQLEYQVRAHYRNQYAGRR